MTAALRAQTLSAPNMTFWLGDPVFFRRSPAHHEECGRVVGAPRARSLTASRYSYDIETADGERVAGVTILRADEEAMRLAAMVEGR